MTMFIHIGYAKCGSTSLQEAFSKSDDFLYPKAGRNINEHISLPLYIKGIDAWNSQFISQEWVESEHIKLMDEVNAYNGDIVISSERICSFSDDQLQQLEHLFHGQNIQIILVMRTKDKFVSSMWRHLVFRHDFYQSYSSFQEHMKNFDFTRIIPLFEKRFPVHFFNLDDPEFEDKIQELLGAKLTLGYSNVGVSLETANILQQLHVRCGTKAFKSIFTKQVKQQLANAIMANDSPILEPFTDIEI